jgi:hypothetical protein
MDSEDVDQGVMRLEEKEIVFASMGPRMGAGWEQSYGDKAKKSSFEVKSGVSREHCGDCGKKADSIAAFLSDYLRLRCCLKARSYNSSHVNCSTVIEYDHPIRRLRELETERVIADSLELNIDDANLLIFSKGFVSKLFLERLDISIYRSHSKCGDIHDE